MGTKITLGDERLRAVNITREFLRDLLDPKKTPRIPRHIRQSAYRCLRHYPGAHDMEQAAKDSSVFNFERAFNKKLNEMI